MLLRLFSFLPYKSCSMTFQFIEEKRRKKNEVKKETHQESSWMSKKENKKEKERMKNNPTRIQPAPTHPHTRCQSVRITSNSMWILDRRMVLIKVKSHKYIWPPFVLTFTIVELSLKYVSWRYLDIYSTFAEWKALRSKKRKIDKKKQERKKNDRSSCSSISFVVGWSKKENSLWHILDTLVRFHDIFSISILSMAKNETESVCVFLLNQFAWME